MGYWGRTGKYQAMYERLKTLVPDTGKAPTPEGELLRSVSQMYYDGFNNGYGNMHVYSHELGVLRSWYDKLARFAESGKAQDALDAVLENLAYFEDVSGGEVPVGGEDSESESEQEWNARVEETCELFDYVIDTVLLCIDASM